MCVGWLEDMEMLALTEERGVGVGCEMREGDNNVVG